MKYKKNHTLMYSVAHSFISSQLPNIPPIKQNQSENLKQDESDSPRTVRKSGTSLPCTSLTVTPAKRTLPSPVAETATPSSPLQV